MEQQLSGRDVPGTLKIRARRIGWGVIPLLTFAGLVSSLETGLSVVRSELNGGGGPTSTVLLGGLCLGLTIVTALWFYRSIRSWMSAALLLAVMVVANCSPLLYKYVPSSFYQDKNLPLLGTTELDHFVFFFPTCLVAFIGFGLLLLRWRNAMRTVPVAIASVVMATLTFVYIVERQRGAWFSLWSAVPLWPLWQMTLASFLGLSLWLGQITTRAGSSTLEPSETIGAGSSLRKGFISLGILVGYFTSLHIWNASVLERRAKTNQQIEVRIKAELAQSLAVAPSRENLPRPEQKPIGEVLLMQGVAGWTPYASDVRMLPAETGLPPNDGPFSRVLLPQRYSSGASYTNGSSDMGLRVRVTTYPTSDWARYELRHTPMTNEQIIHPEWVKKLAKSGNYVYQDGPYLYWPSGNNLVLLDCQGIQQSVIDEFIEAYLEKYPSSL